MAKILIVDDSETVRIQVREALQGSGHTVLEGVDGVDGLAKLEGNAGVDLIICDFNMPNMDGLTMCTKVREMASYKSVPIFMLTTESSKEMKAQAKEIGILAWIVKPFLADKMVAVIGQVLAKTRAA